MRSDHAIRPPTRACLVTHETPLDDLVLNWTHAELPEHERTRHVHRLHPYLGKFVPQIVEVFLRKFFRPGDVVYDPFCGSGTTLVEANAYGVRAIGCDIGAFNCLLTRVKTGVYDMHRLQTEILDILAQTEEQVRPWLFSSNPENDPAPDAESDYITTWYAPQARRDLLSYRAMIDRYQYQDVLKVLLSRAARSARRTTHVDLDTPKAPQHGPYFCPKHRKVCYPPHEALGFLKRYSFDTMRRIQQYHRIRLSTDATIIWGDARTTELSARIDGVITSPPYLGLIDYHDQHRYAYELLRLPQRKEDELGAAWKGRSRQAKDAYLQSMVDVFMRIRDAMKPDGRIVLVVHDRDDLYPEIADRCGMAIEAVIPRRVDCRTGRRSHAFAEHILVWKKRLAR
mgnify:CR=1 FL=1